MSHHVSAPASARGFSARARGEPAVVTTLLRPWENSFRKRGSYLCQSAHTTLFFQPGFCLSSVCLYPGDSAFTSRNQGHAQNHSVPALLAAKSHSHLDFACSGVSLSTDVLHPCLCTTGAALPGQPHPANIPQLPAKLPAPLPIRHVSYSWPLQGPAASAGDTELPKAPGSAKQLQN